MLRQITVLTSCRNESRKKMKNVPPVLRARKYATSASAGKNMQLVPSAGKTCDQCKRGKKCNWCQARENGAKKSHFYAPSTLMRFQKHPFLSRRKRSKIFLSTLAFLYRFHLSTLKHSKTRKTTKTWDCACVNITRPFTILDRCSDLD